MKLCIECERAPDRTVISGARGAGEKANMLWTIFVILGILWLMGFSLNVGGGLIHLLLVVALVVLVVNLVTGRRGLA